MPLGNIPAATTPLFGDTTLATRTPVHETVAEGAVETELPLLKEAPFARDLSFNGAARFLVPAPVVGLVTGVQQVATSLAGIVAPILSGWLLQVSGSYAAPMQVIFVFLLIGALATVFLLRPEWAPKLREPVI
jgi:hypothetical protein